MLWLVVGLGNPGRSYADHRHNVGFMTVDELARRAAESFRAKFKGEVARVRIGAEDAWLLKPMTFMNKSGVPVGLAAGFFQIEPARVVVVHDDLDLEFGRVRVKVGGGHGGHNGLRSIFQHFGKDFVRIRCGIGRPPQGDAVGHVLAGFTAQERAELGGVVDAAADAVEAVLRDGARTAMNEFNGRWFVATPQPQAGEDE